VLVTGRTGGIGRETVRQLATEPKLAAPIVFLLSDDASMISGVSLPIDGGYSSH
jgi:NAD(P)-dependent dehydrogenase (short-subunit alcohol dehydrogenase family)